MREYATESVYMRMQPNLLVSVHRSTVDVSVYGVSELDVVGD